MKCKFAPINIFLFLLSLSISGEAFARCHRGYADHLLQARFTGCAIARITEDSVGPPLGANLGTQISLVCESGCYDADFNEALKPACDRRYQGVLQQFEQQIVRYARSISCRDSGRYAAPAVAAASGMQAPPAPAMPQVQAAPVPSPAPQPPAAAADPQCTWISLQGAALTCAGGARNMNLCSARERTLCQGYVFCRNQGELAGHPVRQGETLALACTHRSDDCRTVDPEACASDPHMSPLEQGILPTASAPAAGRAGAVAH